MLLPLACHESATAQLETYPLLVIPCLSGGEVARCAQNEGNQLACMTPTCQRSSSPKAPYTKMLASASQVLRKCFASASQVLQVPLLGPLNIGQSWARNSSTGFGAGAPSLQAEMLGSGHVQQVDPYSNPIQSHSHGLRDAGLIGNGLRVMHLLQGYHNQKTTIYLILLCASFSCQYNTSTKAQMFQREGRSFNFEYSTSLWNITSRKLLTD